MISTAKESSRALFHGRERVRFWVAILCVAAAVSVVEADDVADARALKLAYQAFLGAKNGGDLDGAVEYSRYALLLGERLHGAEHESVAALTVNLGQALNASGKYTEANEVLSLALKRMEKAYGRSAIELVGVLLELGKAIEFDKSDKSNPLGHFKRARNIAAKTQGEHSLEFAQVNLQAGVTLMRGKPRLAAGKFLKSADEIMSKRLGPTNANVGFAALWLGRYYVATRRYHAGEEALIRALTIFESLKSAPDQTINMTQELLVQTYELSGRSEKATKHCQAIGSRLPWQSITGPKPLYIKDPMYPEYALQARKDGAVTIQFIIDERGFVVEPEVVNVEGSYDFAKPAIKAFAKSRFAPKFVNGKPVASGPVTYTIEFEVERAYGGDCTYPRSLAGGICVSANSSPPRASQRYEQPSFLSTAASWHSDTPTDADSMK